MTVYQAAGAKIMVQVGIPTLTLIRGIGIIVGAIPTVRQELKKRNGNYFSFELDGETFGFLTLRSILTFTALAGSYHSL
jgi:hypothetical protein